MMLPQLQGVGKGVVGAFEGTSKGVAGGLKGIGGVLTGLASAVGKPVKAVLTEAADVSTGYTSRTVEEIYDKEHHRIDHRPEDFPHARAKTAAEFEKMPAIEQIREAFLPETDPYVERLGAALDKTGRRAQQAATETTKKVERAFADEPAGHVTSKQGEDLLLKLGHAAEDVIEGGRH